MLIISRGIRHSLCGHGALPLAGGAEPRPCTLLNNLRNRACAHRVPAYADGEAQALLQRHRRKQIEGWPHVVPRPHHLGPRRQYAHASYVRETEVERGTISLDVRHEPPADLVAAN